MNRFLWSYNKEGESFFRKDWNGKRKLVSFYEFIQQNQNNPYKLWKNSCCTEEELTVSVILAEITYKN